MVYNSMVAKINKRNNWCYSKHDINIIHAYLYLNPGAFYYESIAADFIIYSFFYFISAIVSYGYIPLICCKLGLTNKLSYTKTKQSLILSNSYRPDEESKSFTDKEEKYYSK